MGFVILHLSDSHIGNPKHEVDSDQIFNQLIADIADKAATYGKPNLIIFNGDLAWGQLPSSPLGRLYEGLHQESNPVRRNAQHDPWDRTLRLVGHCSTRIEFILGLLQRRR